jgi:hypothetical protein
VITGFQEDPHGAVYNVFGLVMMSRLALYKTVQYGSPKVGETKAVIWMFC